MTTDLYLAAYLKSKGFRFSGKQNEGRKINFIFEDRKDRDCLINEFLNDGQVNITSFKNALQDMKSILYDYV